MKVLRPQEKMYIANELLPYGSEGIAELPEGGVTLPELPTELTKSSLMTYLDGLSNDLLKAILEPFRGAHIVIDQVLARIDGQFAQNDLASCTEIAGRKPFVNRSRLRALLAQLLEPTSSRILVVRSNVVGSGKSYVAEVIMSMGGGRHPPFVACHCDLANGAFAFSDIAQHLVVPLDADAVPPSKHSHDSTALSHLTTVALWIVEKAREKARERGLAAWIVFDSYLKAHADKREDLASFVAEIAVRVAQYRNEIHGPRLVLIDYAGQLSAAVEECVVLEDIQDRLTTTDVYEYLNTVVQDQKHRDFILDKVTRCEAADEERLDEWHNILRQELVGGAR